MTVTIERPMMFMDCMVPKIVNFRKWMTRRVVKAKVAYALGNQVMRLNKVIKWIPDPVPGNTNWLGYGKFKDGAPIAQATCRHPKGSVAWVREGAMQLGHERPQKNGCYPWPKFADPHKGRCWFADHCYYTADDDGEFEVEPKGRLNKMFMPRWASRYDLKITDVRIERLQEITPEDCVAEGADQEIDHARSAFVDLWERLHGKASWDDNPFVWVYSFARML